MKIFIPLFSSTFHVVWPWGWENFLHCSSLTMFSVFEKSPFVTDLKFKRCVMKYKNRKCPQNPTLTVVEHIGPWMPKIQRLKWLEEERKCDNLRIWHCIFQIAQIGLFLHLNSKFIFRSNWHWAPARQERTRR